MEALEEENNVFGSVNASAADEPRIPIGEYVFVITQFVHFATGVVGLCAQLFLIVVICSHKRLATRTNLLIVNLLAVGAVYYVTTPLFFIFDLFGIWYVFTLVDLVFQLQSTALMLYVVFSALLAVDWSLSWFKREWSERLRRREKQVYCAIYLTGALVLIATVAYVETHRFLLRLLAANFVYVACLLVMVALNALRRRAAAQVDAAASRTEYAFRVANLVIFFMLPCLVWNVPYFFIEDMDVLETFMTLNVVPSTVWMAHPIVMAHKLGEWDKNFKMAYAKALRRGAVRDYDDDGLDEEETEDDARVLVRDAEACAKAEFETVI